MWQLNAAQPHLQIALVKPVDAIEVLQERIFDGSRQHRYSISFDGAQDRLVALPSRTRISLLAKSMSFTRSRKHSIKRRPEP